MITVNFLVLSNLSLSKHVIFTQGKIISGTALCASVEGMHCQWREKVSVMNSLVTGARREKRQILCIICFEQDWTKPSFYIDHFFPDDWCSDCYSIPWTWWCMRDVWKEWMAVNHFWQLCTTLTKQEGGGWWTLLLASFSDNEWFSVRPWVANCKLREKKIDPGHTYYIWD